MGIRSHGLSAAMRREVLPILDHAKMKNRYRTEREKVGGNTTGKITTSTTRHLNQDENRLGYQLVMFC